MTRTDGWRPAEGAWVRDVGDSIGLANIGRYDELDLITNRAGRRGGGRDLVSGAGRLTADALPGCIARRGVRLTRSMVATIEICARCPP
jgi:hypothetical protein